MAEVVPADNKVKIAGLDTLTMIRQLGLFVAIAASVAIGGWVAFWSQEPNYSVLFGSLDQAEASMVMDALQQLEIPYKLDNTTGALLVSSKRVQDAKIKLAAQGLPKGLSGGVFNDDNDSFFVSDTAEKARYKRALEVELSRTITTIANIKSARVHIAIPARRLFVRDRNKPRAAVIVGLYPGRSLSNGQVSAIAHMVASSVPDLSLDNVTVVDQKGRLLTKGESDRQMALSNTQFEYTQKLEKNYMDRIENILRPILGQNAVRAQVTADVDFTFSEQQQETYNPDNPVARSIDILEESVSGLASGGIPGALSNTPPTKSAVPEVAETEQGSNSNPNNRNRRRELKNFELDKTISITRFSMGRLRRLSAAVVIDDHVTTDKKGEIIRAERSPEEIERITTLIKKAIGFNLQRGDSVNVINSPFSVPVEPAPVPDPPIWEQAWLWDVVKQALGGLLVLAILFGVLKPAIKNLSKSMQPVLNLPNAGGAVALANAGGADIAEDQLSLTGGQAQKQLEDMSPYERNLLTAQQAVETDPKLVAQVVKTWVTDDG